MGIGLPIARKLARLMGGDVTVESEFGAGATFFIHLRRADVPTRPQSVPEHTLRAAAR
jgi:two-component system capsular synthesis sensor histidine kinase RcsC